MAKTTGYTRLVCDRCSTEVYAVPGDPTDQSWKEVRRLDSAGVEVTRVLCPSCATAYRTLVGAQDGQFAEFMATGVASGGEA